MRPRQIKEARETLGLTQWELATMLGYRGDQRNQNMHDLENSNRERPRPIGETKRRLLQAYLDGYRPKDWPR